MRQQLFVGEEDLQQPELVNRQEIVDVGHVSQLLRLCLLLPLEDLPLNRTHTVQKPLFQLEVSVLEERLYWLLASMY